MTDESLGTRELQSGIVAVAEQVEGLEKTLFGDARRDSITGPNQFSLNASMDRTFRLHDRLNLETRIDATNALNHVMYSSWNTVVNGSQFGAAQSPQGMRSLQLTMRLRY